MEPAGCDFIDVYRATIEPLYRYVARRAGGSRELTEDVTQEAFLRYCAAWRGERQPAVALAWLQTVARNLLLNHFRRHAPRADAALLDRLQAENCAGVEGAAELVQCGLSSLNRRAAHLIEAYHLDNKDVRTIAAETGLSERAVEGRLRRARQALRRALIRQLG